MPVETHHRFLYDMKNWTITKQASNRTGWNTVLLAVFAIYIMPSASSAGTLSIDEAINTAGKQRMITQRVMKDYALAGMKLDTGNPAANLKADVTRFDASLKALQPFSASAAIAQSLSEVEALWEPIKATLQQPPEKDKARKLQKDLDELLLACNENTMLLTQEAHSKKGDVVNIAGRQRMLSQRMAALYMLKAWKMDGVHFKDKLTKAMHEFSSAHKTLEASPLTTDQIRAKLASAKKSYAWFEMMGRTNSNRVIPALINKSANSILTDMDEATTLYTHIK